MPDEFKAYTPQLQTEYQTELEKELARVRNYQLTLPIEERIPGSPKFKMKSSLEYLELQATKTVTQRFQQLSATEELRQNIGAGELGGLTPTTASDYLVWREKESTLIREQMQVEDNIRTAEQAMQDVGKPTILTGALDFIQQKMFGIIPGDPQSLKKYNDALALYNVSVARLAEISQETIDVKTYQSLYEGMGAYIRSGKVTSYDDLFTLEDVNGEPITRFQELGQDNQTLKDIFNQVSSAVLGLPEGADEKLNYEDMIAQLAKSPEGTPPTGISMLTVSSIIQSLTRPSVEFPSGYRDIDEVLKGYSEAGIPDELVEELESLNSYIGELEGYWQNLSANRTAIQAGLEDAKLPQMGIGALLLQTISQPALTVLDIFGKYYSEWVAPWGSMLYRAKYTYTRIPGLGLTEKEAEYKRLYEEAALTDDWWHAGGKAFEEAHLGFLDRFVFEWILDPVSWAGMGLGKVVTVVGKGNKFITAIGATMNMMDKGWMKAWDVLIFDRIKNLGKLVPKTAFQSATSYAGKDMTNTASYLVKKTGASYYNRIPLSKAKDALSEAMNWRIKHPEDAGSMAQAGAALLRQNALDESYVKELGKRLGSKSPVSKEMVMDVNSITNGLLSEAGAQVLTKKTLPAFLLRSFDVADTAKALKLAKKEIANLYNQGVKNGLSLMDNARDVPELLTNIYNRNHGIYMDMAEAASAHNLEMAGRMSSLVSNVEWKVMNVWRNTFDRWIITPGARMYLAFSAYGPGNVIEGIIKQTMAKQTPFSPLNLLRKNKPVSVVNPTVKGQRLMAGLSKPLELEASIARMEMAGETPSMKLVENLSPEGQAVLSKWRSVLSGGPIGRFFIDLPGRLGTHQRWDYYRKMFTSFLGDEEASAVMSTLAKNIDDAVKTIPDDMLRSLNITKSEFRSELLDRAVMGPQATRGLLDDMVADRLMLAEDIAKSEARKKGKKIGKVAVSADQALADRIAGGRVGEVAGKYPLVPDPFTDDLIQAASDGTLWADGGKAINKKIEDYTAGMYDYFVHSPEFYGPKYKEFVDIALKKEVTNLNEFNEVLSDLQHLQGFYTDSTDDVIRAMNELEGKMSKQMKVHDWNEWRGQYSREVYEGLGKYGDTAQDGFEKVVKMLRDNISNVTEKEQASINQLMSAWTDEQRFLKDFWKTRRAEEVAEIAEIKKLHGEAKSQAWAKFRGNQNKAHALRREQQAPFHDKVVKQEFYSSEALGTLGSYPPTIDASSRKLSKMDVAMLFHSHPQQMGQSMLRLETMTLKSKQQFISEVRNQADIMATRAGKETAAEMGFSNDAIGNVYDDVLRDMYMSPGAASVLEPHLMELKALQDEVWSIYNTKAVPKGTVDNLQGWLNNLTDSLEDVPGYATKKVVQPKAVEIPDYDIGLGQRIASKEDLGIFEGSVKLMMDTGMSREQAIAHVLGIEAGKDVLISDSKSIGKIRDAVTKAAEDVKNIVLPEGQHVSGPMETWTLKNYVDDWFKESNNKSLQTIGRTAEQSPEYVAKIQGILREQYPSGYIRIYRGSGSAAEGALKREFTNVTSSRKIAINFEDTWGAEKGLPTIDNILIKVDDVLSIGSVEESELIVRAGVIRKYLDKPLKIPTPVAPAPRGLSPEFQAAKQRAADKASKEYYKDWADYTNENASTALMRTVYPFWTYELHRLFWLPRAMVQTPGLFKAWGTYMDNTEDGYVHIPGTSMEVNPLRGTIFMGGMVRLMRKDYPEYYDRFPGVSEYFDFYSRFGFYPATYINFLKMFGGKTIQGKANFGEILPAWVKTPLNAYIAAQPDSKVAKLLLDSVLPEPFRDYTTVLLANAICQRERKDFNGMDILDKMTESTKLTPEEEEVWTKAVQSQGWMGALMEQAGIIRIRTEEQLAAWEESGKLIEEMTGYTLEDQLWIRQHGFRIGDYAQLDPLEQSLLGELDAMRYHSGIFTTLMPTTWQEEDRRRREFFDEVRDYSDARKADQEELDRQVMSGELNMKQWASAKSDLSQRNANFFTDLSETERYRDIAIDMEDITRPDGTIREGMISRAKNRNMLPPIEHPAKEILNTYYSIELGKSIDPASGNLVDDWDGYFQRIDTIINALHGANRDDMVEMITKNMTDLVKLRWEISRRYFRGYNRRQTAILLTQFTPEEQAVIKQWTFGTPTERDEMQLVVMNGKRIISEYQSANRITGQNLRTLSPELDAWLQFFEITDTTLTPAAAELYSQYRKEYGIPE